jgi:hypothetical protein
MRFWTFQFDEIDVRNDGMLLRKESERLHSKIGRGVVALLKAFEGVYQRAGLFMLCGSKTKNFVLGYDVVQVGGSRDYPPWSSH